jgi:hypothetical protein
MKHIKFTILIAALAALIVPLAVTQQAEARYHHHYGRYGGSGYGYGYGYGNRYRHHSHHWYRHHSIGYNNYGYDRHWR